MIVIPGDTNEDIIAGIIADEAAIGMINSKTTAVRVIPAIGKKAGDELEFGGLLGSGPVMEINNNSPSKMIRRGGRIPAPIQSLKIKRRTELKNDIKSMTLDELEIFIESIGEKKYRAKQVLAGYIRVYIVLMICLIYPRAENKIRSNSVY